MYYLTVLLLTTVVVSQSIVVLQDHQLVSPITAGNIALLSTTHKINCDYTRLEDYHFDNTILPGSYNAIKLTPCRYTYINVAIKSIKNHDDRSLNTKIHIIMNFARSDCTNTTGCSIENVHNKNTIPVIIIFCGSECDIEIKFTTLPDYKSVTIFLLPFFIGATLYNIIRGLRQL